MMLPAIEPETRQQISVLGSTLETRIHISYLTHAVNTFFKNAFSSEV